MLAWRHGYRSSPRRHQPPEGADRGGVRGGDSASGWVFCGACGTRDADAPPHEEWQPTPICPTSWPGGRRTRKYSASSATPRPATTYEAATRRPAAELVYRRRPPFRRPSAAPQLVRNAMMNACSFARSEGYHIALATALALAGRAVRVGAFRVGWVERASRAPAVRRRARRSPLRPEPEARARARQALSSTLTPPATSRALGHRRDLHPAWRRGAVADRPRAAPRAS